MEESINKLFGGLKAPDTVTMNVREDTAGHPMIPRQKPYRFRQEPMSDFLGWLKGASGFDPLLITGPTASGKSSLAEQVAARLNQPAYIVPCHERMEVPDLFGRFVVRDGSMTWVDGPVIAGLKDPAGAWIIMDEFDSMEPGALLGINPVLEGRKFIVPETGEFIDPVANGAKIICTGNTAGMGDQTGEYLATKRQNVATMGRFAVMEMAYPTEEEELDILSLHRPDLPAKIGEHMIKVASLAREQYIAGEMQCVFCTRSLIRWAHLAIYFRKKKGVNYLMHALDRAIGFKYEPVVREALHQFTQRIFGNDAITIN